MCNEDYFYDNYHLLADSAYTLQNNVLTPYKDNGHLTQVQKNFNHNLSSNRIFVECSIGLLKMRWRRISGLCHLNNIEMVPFYVIACCILHNICLIRDEEFEYVFDLNEGLINRGPSVPEYRKRLLGARKRNDYKDRFEWQRQL